MMQAAVLNKGSPGKRGLWLALVVLILLTTSPAFAATYYMAPNGNNGGAGNSAAPWKTFAFAIPKLNPGDTLILKDGTYTRGTTGMPNINCSAGAKKGTAAAPITLQAENERKAWLKGDGTTTVLGITKCSYWSVVGLRGSDADNTSGGSFFQASYSDHINFRRNLLSNSNRRVNQAMLGYIRSEYGLVEENELYEYTRHGIMLAGSSNVTVRRNYGNSRDYPSAGAIPGIPASSDKGGDSLVVIYPGSNNLVENNISERNLSGFNIQAAGYGGTPSANNRFFGNISLSDVNSGGVRMVSRGDGLLRMPQNTYFENQVVLSAKAIGAWFRANKKTVCQNCSVFNSKTHGFAADPIGPGDGAPTVYLQNSLAVGNTGSGFLFSGQADFGVKNSNSFGNGSNYTPASSSKYSNTTSVDPKLGSCKVFIPDGSPMKGAGMNGNDIGANVLCRYQDGKLTDQQLWNWSTGQFPCGAIIAGVNDKAGESCFDVNKRLNVNANGCTLPATPSCKQPAPPTDLPSTGDGGGGANPCPPGGVGTGTGAPADTAGTGGAGASANGPTYYISPNGSDSNSGTSPSSPWLTFAHALNPARAWCGKTLALLDGTYGDGTRTGKVNLSNANCAAGNALTIKAQNQRKAKIVDNGSSVAVLISKSAYVIVDGLFFTSANNSSKRDSSNGRPSEISRSNHITFRNNIGQNPNKFANAHVFPVLYSQDVLLEDNEAYDFARHCVTGWNSERVVVRRQYCNPRIGALPGGINTSGYQQIGTGDAVFSMYPCTNCILENSIADGPMFLNEMNSTYGDNVLMSGSKVLGSICVGCRRGNGIYPNSRKAADLNHTPQNILIENVAIVDHNGTGSAIRASDGVNLTIQNLTAMGAGSPTGITLDDTATGATPAQQSATIRDVTVQGFTGAGFNREAGSYSTLNTSNLNSYNNGRVSSGAWGAISTTNPGMGSCKVFIPDGSPLKGAGTNGGDIGANILCRYENGVLTDQQLWDWNTGQFPCKAIVPGVNDVPGKSCFDVNKRLNVNANGCTLPANPTCKQPAPPTGLPPPGESGSTGCNTIKIVTEDESCVKAGAPAPLSIKLVDAVTNQPVTPPGDVYISLIPPGFRLSAGTVFQSTPMGSVYKLTPAQLSSLSITPPPGYDGTLTMSISYTPPIPGATASTTTP